MIYNVESDLKATLANWYGDAVWWVEHGSGGSPGVLDSIFLVTGRFIPVELKCEKSIAKIGSGVRPSQRKFIRASDRQHVETFVLSCIKGTSDVFLTTGSECLRTNFHPVFLVQITDKHQLLSELVARSR